MVGCLGFLDQVDSAHQVEVVYVHSQSVLQGCGALACRRACCASLLLMQSCCQRSARPLTPPPWLPLVRRRYCQYQISRKGGAAPDAAALLESIGGAAGDQLQSKLASLAAEAKAAQAAATSSLSWSGETYPVRDEKIRIPLHTAQVGGRATWAAAGAAAEAGMLRTACRQRRADDGVDTDGGTRRWMAAHALTTFLPITFCRITGVEQRAGGSDGD